MKIFDISLPLTSDLPVWPNDPKLEFRRTMSLEAGHLANVTHISCCVHIGTHVDAPYHFIKDGTTVDELPLDVLIGPVYVGDLPDVNEVSPEDLEQIGLPKHIQRLLLRTRNSKLWADETSEFTPDYVALTPKAAAWVVGKGIRLVGCEGAPARVLLLKE